MGKEKQNILEGAVILTASTLIVKLIGALFKIPLANILGGVGMSYFVSAYDVLIPIYSVTVTGMGVAVSRMISEGEHGFYGDSPETVLVTARRLFYLLGISAAFLLYTAAVPLTRMIGNPGAAAAVRCIAPSVLFSCISSAYRGYFQGKQNMLPTAVSQVLESVAKLLFGTGLTFCVVYLVYPSTERDSLQTLQSAAAAAVSGVMLSTLLGMLYIRSQYRKDRSVKENVRYSSATARQLIKIALPIALTSLSANLTTVIDLSSVMNCLQRAAQEGSDVILTMYQNCIPPEVTADVLPEYLYGSYSGLAVSVFNLVPALTAGIGVSAIPIIAAHRTRGERRALQHAVDAVITVTALAAFPAGVGIFTFSKEILAFLYPHQLMEAAIVAPTLKVMGIVCILIAFGGILNSILQAAGREKIPLAALLMGGIIKMVTNFILVSQPQINIHGVAYGSLLCYITIAAVDLIGLKRAGQGLSLRISVLLRPLLAALGCCAAARMFYDATVLRSGNAISLVLSIGIAAAVYFLLLAVMGIHRNETIKILVGGAKR